jgi:hypothetical protein
MSTSVNHTEQPFTEIIESRQFPKDVDPEGELVCRIMSDGWEIGTWIEEGWEGAGPVARKILAVNDLLEFAKLFVELDKAHLLFGPIVHDEARAAIAKVEGGAA